MPHKKKKKIVSDFINKGFNFPGGNKFNKGKLPSQPEEEDDEFKLTPEINTKAIFSSDEEFAQGFEKFKIPAEQEKKDGPRLPPPTNDPILKIAREKGLSLEAAADIFLAKQRQSPERRLLQESVESRNIQAAQQEAIQLQAAEQDQLINAPSATTEELGEGNVFENVTTGAAALGGAVVGAKLGSAAGAAVGTLIAPGIGTLVGGITVGVAGAAVGAIGGAYTKLTIQRRQQVKEADKIWKQARTNKNEILNMVNGGILTEGRARQLWAEEKSNIALSHSYLKQQTQSDLNNFLGNPGDELIALEAYLGLDTEYDLEFERALLAPDPRKIALIPPEAEA